MLSDAMTERVAKRFGVLAAPMRLRILQVLEDGEKPVGDIVGILRSSQPNISKHLKSLCQEGLVGRRREGLNIWYSVADSMVFQLCDLICRNAIEQTRSQLAELAVRPRARKRKGAGLAVRK